MKTVVLDTNIPLLDASYILRKEELVVLPETVLAELDNKKSGFEEINYQAREVARLLESAEIIGSHNNDGVNTTELMINGEHRVDIVALSRYEADAESYGGNDRRIIEVAKRLGKQLITNDIHMKFQAIAQEVEVTSLKQVEDTAAEFVKEFVVGCPEQFRTLHNANVLEVDPDYQVGNYSYKFTCENTNQMKLATVQNGFLTVLGKETETQLRKQEVNPMGLEQLLLSKAIQDPTIDMVVVEAKSGSGKTVSAVSNAMRAMKLHKDKYRTIIYVRNSVVDLGSKDEDTGFVSGNEEKVSRFLHPLEDTLDYIARSKINTKGKKPDEVEESVSRKIEEIRVEYKIQSMITNDMRGRTFANAIVIVDEVQNQGTSTMQKVLTRMGKDTKVILVGSQKQIDSSYLNRYNNGLAILLNECSTRKLDTDINMFAINLHKVLRSPMSEFGEDLFTKV